MALHIIVICRRKSSQRICAIGHDIDLEGNVQSLATIAMETWAI
jgi:hypothetical protein